MKHNSYTIHLAVNGTDVVKPVKVAKVIAKHVQSVYNTSSTVGCNSGLLSSDFFTVASHFQIRHFAMYTVPPSKMGWVAQSV